MSENKTKELDLDALEQEWRTGFGPGFTDRFLALIQRLREAEAAHEDADRQAQDHDLSRENHPPCRRSGLTLLATHNSAGRARGSRSLEPAVLGIVTKGPPSSGVTLVNATSGISLGKPASGKSFRNGKNG